MDLPTLCPGISAEAFVGIDGAWVPDERQHGQVIVRIGVGVAAGQVKTFSFGDGIDRHGLAFAMKHFADKFTCVNTINVFGDGAQRPGQPESAGDGVGNFDRCGGDKPYPLTAIEMLLRERACAGPDLVSHVLVEDLFADLFKFGDRMALDEGQTLGTGLGNMFGILDARDAKIGLLPHASGDVSGREELTSVQSTGKMEDRSALHNGVVDIEKRRCFEVGFGRHCVFYFGGCSSRLTSENRPRLKVQGVVRCVFARHGWSLSGLPAYFLWLTQFVIVNASEYLRAAAHEHGDDVALVEHREERRELSWNSFDAAADAVARGLSSRGLVAGHRVAIAMSNRIDLAVAYYGILRGGMVAVPMNPRSTAGEIKRMLSDSKAHVVLCDEIGVNQVREATAGLEGLAVIVGGAKTISGETSFVDFLAGAIGTDLAAPQDAESLAVLLYTSGTSGKPRGVMLPHRAIIANIEQIALLDPPAMTSDDTCLALLPLFHIYGLNCVLGQAVKQGAIVLLVDGFDPVGLLDLIEAEGVTNLPIAPPVIAAWAGREDLRDKLAGVQSIMSGASALDVDLAEQFESSSGHFVDQGYGLTETSPVIATTLGSPRATDGAPKRGSVGRPLPGIELRIVESSGEDANPGDPAEIWVRGDNVFTGYWPDGIDGPNDEGWYATGDIGFLDDDADLTLVDRLRELVIVSGFNVYPFEVEDVIAEIGEVSQVAVVGVPDEDTGESVLAFVVPSVNADESALTIEIEAHCEARLARFKIPKRIVIVKGLPYSATGKVAKGRLRALARSETLGLDQS